jgi:hypothetical protein
VKRVTYTFAVLSLLIIADGIYLELSNNQQGCGCNGDSGTLFGGATSINLSTGTEVLIGGGLLLIVTGIVWLVSMRRNRGPAAANGPAQASPAQASQSQAARAQAGQSPAKADVVAGQSQVAKETDDQLQ